MKIKIEDTLALLMFSGVVIGGMFAILYASINLVKMILGAI
jgi:hypothetical protein